MYPECFRMNRSFMTSSVPCRPGPGSGHQGHGRWFSIPDAVEEVVPGEGAGQPGPRVVRGQEGAQGGGVGMVDVEDGRAAPDLLGGIFIEVGDDLLAVLEG